MQRQLHKNKFGKVRVLFGAAALFVLLLSMTAQAAGKTSWLANKDEWPKQTGYHLGKLYKTRECPHSADDNFVIAVSINGNDLTPNKTYLKNNFKLRGATSKMSQKYKNQMDKNKIYWETLNITGINSHMVSNQVAKLKVNGKEIVLAAPYLCPDGYAGYAYFRHYFSYCPNTSEIYHTGTSEHVCLICTKDGAGIKEYHPNEYIHNIYQYYIEPNKYTISYNGNGSTSGSTSSQSATYDEALKLRNNGYKRSGYTFTEWNTKKDGSGTSYNPGKSVKNLTAKDGGTVTLYAQWEKATYQLTVKPNGGTWNGKTTDQGFSLKYAATKSIADPTRPGHTFAGWTLTGAGSIMSGKTFTMGTANASLTAKWTANTYQLTVKPNGGTWNGRTTDQGFSLKYAATKSIADPTRPGYTFAGWTLTGAGSTMSGKTFTMGIANASLTAKWKANTYTITFDGNGATEGSMESITATADVPIQLPANAFKRVTEQGDSLFLGWALVPEPEGHTVEFADQAVIDQSLTQNAGETVTLYAIWDDCPQIETSDRYFNLWWAQNGKITEEELLRTASAVDKEDNELENRTKAQIEESGLPGSLSLLDYDPEAFTSMTEDGTVNLTYRAVDSAGNTVYETVQVHVYSTAAIPLPEKYTRYINRKYYEKSYEEGGLHPDSIFRTDPEHKQALEEALDNIDNDTPVASYYFTHEEVEEAQDYITEHGIGNTKEPDALQNFYDRFMKGKDHAGLQSNKLGSTFAKFLAQIKEKIS